jgi:hypothetical protein
MTPSTGRIVHYVSHGTPGGEYASECRAAIVTAVQPGGGTIIPETASLAVLNPTGMFFNEDVRQDEGSHRGGTWHWPERT